MTEASPATGARCIKCRAPATWLRGSLERGGHLFCDAHAQAEPGFLGGVNGQSDWLPVSGTLYPGDRDEQPVPLDEVEPDVLERLVAALGNLKSAAKATRQGLVSDHCENAAREVRAAIRLAGG